MGVSETGGFGSFLFLAFALGLDGFSVSLGYGMQRVRLRQFFIIGLMIGIFHILLPFFGMLIGHFVSQMIEYVASLVGGALLVAVGAYIVFSSLQKREHDRMIPQGMKLLSVAFAVSIDSLPVGISLGLSSLHTIGIVFLIGGTTAFMSWTGMMIGNKAQAMLGIYSELLGGVILFFIGVRFLFGT